MKLFDIRNTLKSKIHWSYKDKEYLESFYVNQREIRYCHLGINVWYEEDGKWNEFRRPVLILKKIWSLYRIAPMTSVPKDNNRFYHILHNDSIEYYEEVAKVEKSWIILSQIKVIDKTRFIHKIANISKNEFEIITKKLKILLF